MSQTTPRRSAPVIADRRSKPPHHPSPSPRRRTPARSSIRSKPIKILKRCSSAPLLLSDTSVDGDYDHNFRHGGTLFRPQTFYAAFESCSSLFASTPQSHEMQEYDKEAKVVLNVTVEGSPGPIRTMVKLGSRVDDTISLVVEKYSEEGRTPKIDPNAASSFQLYDSYFSLQGLDKSELIGDVGSRNFYLRKSNEASPFNSFRLQTVPGLARESSAPSIPPPPFLLPSFIARAINKMVRRVCRIWKIVVCSQ